MRATTTKAMAPTMFSTARTLPNRDMKRLRDGRPTENGRDEENATVEWIVTEGRDGGQRILRKRTGQGGRGVDSARTTPAARTVGRIRESAVLVACRIFRTGGKFTHFFNFAMPDPDPQGRIARRLPEFRRRP